MHDLSNFKPVPKKKSNLRIYLFIAALAVVNSAYFNFRHYFSGPKYQIQNGGKVISVHKCDTCTQACFMVYVFNSNGREYIDSIREGIAVLPYMSSFVGRYLPVIYIPNGRPDHGLMFLPAQFNSINVRFPDSLKWVEQVLPWTSQSK